MARDMVPEAETPTRADDAPDVIRRRWLAELRRQGARQCFEAYYSKHGDLVCALGLLREIAISDVFDRDLVDDVGDVGALAGLTERQAYDVTYMNDGSYEFLSKHTFAEIADVVEGWFR